MNLVDSSGWLEYLGDNTNANFFASSIEDLDSLVVSTLNIYEVFKKVIQQLDESSAIQAIAIMHQGLVVDVDNEIALMAGKISLEYNLPRADSVIYATATKHDAILWTQDSDFKDLENVQFIQKKSCA